VGEGTFEKAAELVSRETRADRAWIRKYVGELKTPEPITLKEFVHVLKHKGRHDGGINIATMWWIFKDQSNDYLAMLLEKAQEEGLMIRYKGNWFTFGMSVAEAGTVCTMDVDSIGNLHTCGETASGRILQRMSGLYRTGCRR